jgi:membrane-bound lytic murein transglycosylase D
MLGRASLYFPMFEEELAAGGLPTDLKYLAVVESALSCQAISPVGAAGLWQFMRPTARECGLTVTKYVDERCDPLKATRAAIKYLTFLHDQFESWELAMAAYNSGPGRVRYAIRKSGSKDYWKLQRYLPRETRAYVPGFIAASYILNYYQDHGLAPEYPSSDFTHTETVEVFKSLSFSEISSVTGVPMEVIQELNPVFIRKYIPQSNSGYPLKLPVFAATAMRIYLTEDAAPIELVNFEGIETGVDVEYVDRLVEETYIIRSGDNLYNIARVNGCSVDDLKAWNRLSSNTIHIGQRLKVKKMSKVLIRVPKATPVARALVEVPLLPVQSFVTRPADIIREVPIPNVPAPTMRTQLNVSSSPVVIRRRTSLRSMGINSTQVHSVLAPGTSLE